MSTESQPGIFGSIKALLERVLTLIQGRAELFTTELEEELTRLIGVMLWSLASVFAAIIGVTFLAVMVLLFVPTEDRAVAAAVIALLFLAVAGFGYASIRRILRAKSRPFDASLRELEKDRQQLRGDR